MILYFSGLWLRRQPFPCPHHGILIGGDFWFIPRWATGRYRSEWTELPYLFVNITVWSRAAATAIHLNLENPTAVWMYHCVRGLLPSYLQNIFVPNSEIHQHYTRQSSGVYMPRPRINMLKRSFEYLGTVLWNSLSGSTRTAKSLNVLKQLI